MPVFRNRGLGVFLITHNLHTIIYFLNFDISPISSEMSLWM